MCMCMFSANTSLSYKNKLLQILISVILGMADSMNIDNVRISYMMQDANTNSIFAIQNHIPWDDDSGAKFVCSLCNKTFYNANALQNHKNMQHDVQCSGSDGEFQSATGQGLNGGYDYKFIPLKKPLDQSVIIMQKDGITTKSFSEDTSFLIVKVEGVFGIDDKRRRLEGVVKRARMKPVKQTVDLRGPFTCTLPSTVRPDLQCHQVFFNCCQYSLHYREEHTKRRKAALRCQICEKRLDEDFYLGSLRAPARATFSCRMCNKTFHDSLDYDEHNSSVHAKVKPHQCSICAKRFTQQGGLQQHMRMHSGIRPFACTFCPKAFTQRAGLDQHLRIHTKIKPFKCVICHKCFSQSVHLRQHMRTHTNIQPFECTVCGRRFKQTSHLNFHMRSHANECQAGVMEKLEQLALHDQASPLSLARLQPVQDGDTLYYAAELTTPTNPHFYQQVAESGSYLHD